ncbi:MAG TPA: outer membrane protein transport protein [Edaphocola sp.]|nr:outer membrane protein transport protein [Edaphocola sp.]
MRKLLTGMLFLSPLALFGQGYQLNLQGARQVGMGSTGLANPNDATALFTNPGSAVFVEDNGITIGGTAAFSKGTFTDANSNVVNHSDNPIVTPFFASGIYGSKNGKWKYGISVYTPFGSAMKWEPESVGRFETREISLVSVSFQPTVSYKVTEKLGLGVGLSYTYGHVNIQKDVPVQFLNGNFGDANIDAKAGGFGVNTGLYFKATDKLALAFSYRSRIKMESTSGTATFNVPESIASNFPNQDITATLPLPQVFGVGATYKFCNDFKMNAEVYLSDWTKYDTVRVNYTEQPVAGENSSDLVRDYKYGYSARVGAEYTPERRYELRAGLMYSVSPIQKGYVNPDVPDANRINPSIGGSYVFSKNFKLDLALLAEFVNRKDKNVISGIYGTYNFTILLPTIGLTYNF